MKSGLDTFKRDTNDMAQCAINEANGNTIRRTCLDGSLSNRNAPSGSISPAPVQPKGQDPCEQMPRIPSSPTGYRARTATAREQCRTSRTGHSTSTTVNRNMSNAVDCSTNATEKIKWCELDSLTQSALVRAVLYNGSVDILEGDVWEDVRRKLLTIQEAAEFQQESQ